MSAPHTLDDLDGETMVQNYIRNGSEASKHQAVQSYLPLVKHIVGRLQLPEHGPLRREDLIQFGIIGLLDALERFQPHNGATFKTYAYRRIYGEIIDAVRREGNLTRSQIAVAGRVGRTVDRLRAELGSEPTPVEICAEADVTEDEYERMRRSLTANFTLSLDEQVALSEEDVITLKDVIADAEQILPDAAIEKKEMQRRLKRIIKHLPERKRLILALYYYEELTFADIGQVLGISESRVCQIHNHTLAEIRAELKDN